MTALDALAGYVHNMSYDNYNSISIGDVIVFNTKLATFPIIQLYIDTRVSWRVVQYCSYCVFFNILADVLSVRTSRSGRNWFEKAS